MFLFFSKHFYFLIVQYNIDTYRAKFYNNQNTNNIHACYMIHRRHKIVWFRYRSVRCRTILQYRNTNALQNDSGLKKEEVFISRETQRREVTRNHQLLGTICLPDCIIQAGLPIPACRSQFRQAVRREFYLLLLLL